MSGSFTFIDFSVFGLCLLAMLAGGVWGGRTRQTSDGFLLANRTMRSWPLGLSLAVGSAAAIYYCAVPMESYTAGLKLLLVPMMLWVTLPIVFWCVVPLCFGLELESVYEYLELRFDLPTRTAASGLFFLWQLPWLAGVLALPCAVLFPGAGLNAATLTILLAGGGITTLYTYLGGIRAAVRTDVLQLALMVAGLLLVIVAVWSSLESPARIWEVADRLDRNTIVNTSWDWSARWSIWAALPCMVLLPLFFYVADQATVQRLLAAADDHQMKRSLITGYVLLSLLVPMLIYAGLGLLAVYHDNARDEFRPNWIVNSAVDGETGRSLIGLNTVIDAETLPELLARKAILAPNTDRPMTDSGEIIDARGRINIDRLATRELTGERRLRRGGGELFSRFVRRHVPMGLAGVVLAGLVAAAMAVVDSGIGSLATLFAVDFHRRLGWAERWLAERRSKRPDDLDQADEFHLIRPLVLVIGVAIIGLSLVVVQLGNVLGLLIALLNVFAGPLLAVFLLGMFTRRATGPAVLTALVLGTLAAAWLTLGCFASDCSLWPWKTHLGVFWPLPLSVAGTATLGYGLSFVLGQRKDFAELTGLVAGLGPWGILVETEPDQVQETEGIRWIEDEPDNKENRRESPWR